MSSGWTAPGVNNVPEYLVSGVPWVTSSLDVDGVVKISFPNVTRFFKVKNVGSSDVSVGFTEAGVAGSHYFTVSTGTVEHFDIKIRDLYLSGTTASVDVLGGLTSIPRRNYQHLTGANPPPDGMWYIPGIE